MSYEKVIKRFTEMQEGAISQRNSWLDMARENPNCGAETAGDRLTRAVCEVAVFEKTLKVLKNSKEKDLYWGHAKLSLKGIALNSICRLLRPKSFESVLDTKKAQAWVTVLDVLSENQ